MESEEGRGSEFAWLPDTSGTVARRLSDAEIAADAMPEAAAGA